MNFDAITYNEVRLARATLADLYGPPEVFRAIMDGEFNGFVNDKNEERFNAFLNSMAGMEVASRHYKAMLAIFSDANAVGLLAGSSSALRIVIQSPVAMQLLVSGNARLNSMLEAADDSGVLKTLMDSDVFVQALLGRKAAFDVALGNKWARMEMMDSATVAAALAARPTALQWVIANADGMDELTKNSVALRTLAGNATTLPLLLAVPTFIEDVDNYGRLGDLVAGATALGVGAGQIGILLADAKFRAAILGNDDAFKRLLDNAAALAWLFADADTNGDGGSVESDVEDDRESNRNGRARERWAEAVLASSDAIDVMCDHAQAMWLLGRSWRWADMFSRSATAVKAICESHDALMGVLSGTVRSSWRNNGSWETMLASPLLTQVSVPVMTSDSAPSGQVSASSVSDAAHAAFTAFDGNPDTGWQPAAGQGLGAWVQYSFDQPCVIVSAQLVTAGSGGVNTAYIECSEDGSAWVQAGNIWSWAWESPDNVIEVTGGLCKYWRLRVDSLQDPDWAGSVNDLTLRGVR